MTEKCADSVLRVLDGLCPMHLVLDGQGLVVHCGATLRKIFAPIDPVGLALTSLFVVKRPRSGEGMQALLARKGKKVQLAFRAAPYTEMKGIVLDLSDTTPGCIVLNLSFGISLIEAVRSYNLTNGDFAVTDLATEMLYLHEANSAAMEASRQLNQRLQGAKLEAEKQAFTDTLTGLNNRRALDPLIARLVEKGENFALMHLDLDHFKPVNDRLGHAAGDHVLCEVAQILRKATRSGDTIIRSGGDEFILVFSSMPKQFDLNSLAERLLRALSQPIAFNDATCEISASVGIALSAHYATPRLDEMMEDADMALYAAKAQGRARYVVYSTALRHVSNDTATQQIVNGQASAGE
ncbi:MAG: diguanylate cyclase [Pseudomonadota bacterium]